MYPTKNQNSEKPSEKTTIKPNNELIIRNLSSIGLEYQKVDEDGHCLYQAVAFYLKNGEGQKFLRSIVAAHLEENLEKFCKFIQPPAGKTITDYINDIRAGTEWADHIELEVLMQVLDRPIIVIGPDGKIRNHNEDLLQQFKGEPIFVYYNGHTHYDALILNNEVATAQQLIEQLTQVGEYIENKGNKTIQTDLATPLSDHQPSTTKRQKKEKEKVYSSESESESEEKSNYRSESEEMSSDFEEIDLIKEDYEFVPELEDGKLKLTSFVSLAFQAIKNTDLPLLTLLMDFYTQFNQKDDSGTGKKLQHYDSLEKKSTRKENILREQATLLSSYEIITVKGYGQLNRKLDQVIKDAEIQMRINYGERFLDPKAYFEEGVFKAPSQAATEVNFEVYKKQIQEELQEFKIPPITTAEEAVFWAKKRTTEYKAAHQQSADLDAKRQPFLELHEKIKKTLDEARHETAQLLIKKYQHFLPEGMSAEEFIEQIQDINLNFTIQHPTTGESLLLYAIRHHQPLEIIKFLLDHGAPVAITPEKKEDDILLAVVKYGHAEAALALISHCYFSASWLDKQDNKGNTLLFYAIEKVKCYPLATLLLQKGANLYHKNVRGIAPWQHLATLERQRIKQRKISYLEENIHKKFRSFLVTFDFDQRGFQAFIQQHRQQAQKVAEENYTASYYKNKKTKTTFAKNSYFAQAKEQLELKDYFQALPNLYEAIFQEPSNLQLWLELGKCLGALGMRDLAIQIFDAAIILAKTQQVSTLLLAQCHVEKGLTLELLGKTREALTEYNNALRKSAGHRPALWQKVHLLSLENKSLAEELCSRALTVYPQDVEFIMLRAEIRCVIASNDSQNLEGQLVNYRGALADYQYALTLVNFTETEKTHKIIAELSQLITGIEEKIAEENQAKKWCLVG